MFSFTKSSYPPTKGVSDAIGYMLIVGIIFASISSVYLVGFDYLNTARDIEEDQNIERSLSIFMSNENEVVNGYAPSRSTEIRLGDNKITTKSSVAKMKVVIPSRNTSYVSNSSIIRYSSPLGAFIYEMGSILKTTTRGSDTELYRFVERPENIRYIAETDSMHIQMLSIRSGEGSLTGGIREIILSKTGNSVDVYNFSSKQRVRIYITSPRIMVWNDHYEQLGGIENCEPYGHNQIVCYTKPIDELNVQQTGLTVKIY